MNETYHRYLYMRAFIVIVLTFVCPVAFAQSPMRLQGKVVDAETKQALAFVNIVGGDNTRSTATNENGEFVVDFTSIPLKLTFSYIGYDKKVLSLEMAIGYIEIELKPGTIILSEIVVSGERDTDYVKNLWLNAFKKVKKQETHKIFAKAFYRQLTKNDDVYSEVYEIFYHTQVSSKGIDQWQIQQGRYAISEDMERKEYVYTLNFTFLSQSFSLSGEDRAEAFITPFNRFSLKKYKLSIHKVLENDGRKVAVIDFIPATTLKTPALAGQVWLDIDSYDILRMQAELKDPQCKLIEVSGPKKRWSNYHRKYDIAFKKMKDTLVVPDYFRIEHSMHHAFKNRFARKVVTSSVLTFYEYTDSLDVDGFVKRGEEDLERIKSVKYDPQFWEYNPFLSRTPLEEEVIRSLQESGSVGNLLSHPKDK